MSAPEKSPFPWRPVALGAAVALLAGTLVVGGLIWTRPTRAAVTTYVRLLAAANQQDLATLRSLCSARYLQSHRVVASEEGGVVGLPRNINKNFQVWREGPHVWLCPTNRVGPIYQFVLEAGAWKFDGPIGILRGRGEVVHIADLPTTSPEFENRERGPETQEERESATQPNPSIPGKEGRP